MISPIPALAIMNSNYKWKRESSSKDNENSYPDYKRSEDLDFNQNSKRKTLEELVKPISTKYCLSKEIKRLQLVFCFIGASNNNKRINCFLRFIAWLTWFVSIAFHFSSDVYEAFKVYGWTFLTAQVTWLIAFLLSTWATAYRTLPWLEDGLKELREDRCYEKSIYNILFRFKRIPYGLLMFGLISSGIQHGLLSKDNAAQVDFGQNLNKKYNYVLQFIRFITSAHVYFAYGSFWVIASCIMLITGYAMTEFMDQMGAKMRDKENILMFKEAIGAYSKRAKFVKTSSSKCFVVLMVLIVAAVICFGLNAYMFLFHDRRYLHVWHSLLPMILMIYPLCTAAWVTKQHRWFIIVVVRAWVHRDDLDDSSSDESETDDGKRQHLEMSQSRKVLKSISNFVQKSPRIVNRKSTQRENGDANATKELTEVNGNFLSKNLDATSKFYSSNFMDTSDAPTNLAYATDPHDNLDVKEEDRSNAKMTLTGNVGAVRAIAKFHLTQKKPRLNFEKFLSYLESMRTVVGFHIAGVMVTWDLVSTILFFFFSILAVFLQESIFGSQRSTLET